MTPDEYKALAKPKKAKYRNRKTVVDGITFDSKAEADFYSQLRLRERLGEVDSIKLQVPHILTVNGQLIATYRSDFEFNDIHSKKYRVIDVKGVQTPEFKLKRKLMRACHGIEIEIIKVQRGK